MASESGEAGGMSQYIDHHLQHLANKHQEGLFDPSVIHRDTLFLSLLCAAIVAHAHLVSNQLAVVRRLLMDPGHGKQQSPSTYERPHEWARGRSLPPCPCIPPAAATLQPAWRCGFDDVADDQAEQLVCGRELPPPARDEVFQTPREGIRGCIDAQLDDVRT